LPFHKRTADRETVTVPCLDCIKRGAAKIPQPTRLPRLGNASSITSLRSNAVEQMNRSIYGGNGSGWESRGQNRTQVSAVSRRVHSLYTFDSYLLLFFAYPHPTALPCRYASPSSSTSSARPVQGLPGQYSQPYTGTTDAANPGSLQRVRSQARLQTIGSLHRHRSAHLEVTGGPPVETNDTPPYKHWQVVCAACGKITLGRPCTPRREIEPIEHNPVIKCRTVKTHAST
jgi:hypothetical protein